MSSKNNKINTTSYPSRVRGMNLYDSDKNLQMFLKRSAPTLYKTETATLQEVGDFAGNRLDIQAEQSDQSFPPVLIDLPDNATQPNKRKKELRLNSEYEACQQELYKYGLVSKCFDKTNPASHILPFVGQYLVSKSDISTGCPFAMTHPVAFVIDKIAPKEVKERFLPEILRTDGKTAICGTWATEKHSGSDVGGTVTEALPSKGHKKALKGHNWFTSAFGFQKFITLKTARPSGASAGSKGLGLYLVPSHKDRQWTISNNYEITHLKRKLGTKGLPTVEVELDNTIAYEVAPQGQGLSAMMIALGCSRVHNAMAAAGVMHRAYLETMCWLENRVTFGQPLIQRPMMQKRALDIATQWMAGSALAFEACRSFDSAATDPKQAVWMRLVTALAKFKTAEQAVWCTEKALEAVGGNGYTEDYPTSRQYRDSMVLRVWEGPEQIQALELIRMIAGKEPGDKVFIDKLTEIKNSLPDEMKAESLNLSSLINEAKNALSELRQNPKKAELSADEYLNYLSEVLAYALLCEEASWEMINEKDLTKKLFADHFYQNTFMNIKKPSLSKTNLHNHFNDIARGNKISQSKPNISNNSPKSGGSGPQAKNLTPKR